MYSASPRVELLLACGWASRAPARAGELPREMTVRAGERQFEVTVRIDTPKAAEYFRHGGILQYVLRQLLAQTAGA